ncbi:hypothetical protein K438DRAFT_1783919 [Mycena galopus ATCC 62051]|nr:hypothetical protein K438DRAFT_1783919 [Mycena galopus ATCC 62051]
MPDNVLGPDNTLGFLLTISELYDMAQDSHTRRRRASPVAAGPPLFRRTRPNDPDPRTPKRRGRLETSKRAAPSAHRRSPAPAGPPHVAVAPSAPTLATIHIPDLEDNSKPQPALAYLVKGAGAHHRLDLRVSEAAAYSRNTLRLRDLSTSPPPDDQWLLPPHVRRPAEIQAQP